MTSSETVSSEMIEAPCVHVIGLGRTGAVYVEALLRTGEIEDLLAQDGATFSALVVDIGDDDISLAQDYGYAFTKRLESRGIPTDRYLFQAVPLAVPSEADLVASVKSASEALKKGTPGLEKAKLESYLPKSFTMPKPGEHFPRALAKAIYADASMSGSRPLDAALTKFAEQVGKATLPSIVLVCFSLAGGTGSGMVVDLARHLSKSTLGARTRIVGVGQLPHTGDPATYKHSAALYTALNDLDCMLDDEKNAAIVAKYGDAYKNPFTGGFFVVNPEQSWQRLTAYTTTGEAMIRQAIKEMVTNRFVGDSFMRWCVGQGGKDLMRVLKSPEGSGKATAMTAATSRNWTLFDVAKLTHPGVQVLPGEAPSKWGAVISQWIGFTPKYDGLKDGFKTDYAHVAMYGSRNMGQEDMLEDFKSMMKSTYLLDDNTELPISMTEFFDVLTAYANVVLLGVAKTDLEAFWSSQKTFDQLSGEDKMKEHAFLIDVGPMLSDPKAKFDGLPAQCASGQPVVAPDIIRGDRLPPPNRRAEATVAAH